MIPKVFHRVWLGRKPLPPEFARWGESWLDHHPGWTMKTWTEKELPPTAFPKAYYRMGASYAHKADIARYEVLAREGGVYVDTDFECFRSIEPLIEGLDAFTAAMQEQDSKCIANGLFGAVPRHSLLLDVLRELPFADAGTYSLGPPFWTRMVRKHPEVKVFSPELFYPYPHWQPERRSDAFPGAYGAHHWASTWTDSWRPAHPASASKSSAT